MYQEEVAALALAAEKKSRFMEQNALGYLLASMLAGCYVGLGIMLIYTIGGLLAGAAHAKILMGVSFGIALSLVIIAGAELFTGNNLVMMAGVLRGGVGWAQAAKLWVLCFVGNWLGAVVLALLFWGAGLATASTGDFIAGVSASKMATPPVQLFLRGFLCNILVCLATWCSYRCKSDSGKRIMIFWCLYCFITSGYEHGIANMSLLTVGLLAPGGAAVSFAGYLYNILLVSFGNMLGAIVVIAVPYYVMSRDKTS